MFDMKKTIARLLNLSELILNEIDVLADLSYHDMENSTQFDDHLTDIKNYLNQEQVILHNIDLASLIALYKEFDKYDSSDDAYLRTMVNIDDRINELFDSQEDDSFENTYQEEDDVYDDCESLLDKYHVDEGDNEKYAINVIDDVATIVIKKMLARIDTTATDNRQDNKYKKRLIRNFKKFKYFYFTLDNQLEILGAHYRFNVDSIPMPLGFNIDTSDIFHNQCVTILDKLYSFGGVDYDLDSITEALFNVMMLEEYLTGIPDDSVSKLLEFTTDLEKQYGENYYGNIAKKKLLCKKN